MKKQFLPTLVLICLFSSFTFGQKEEKQIERSLKVYAAFQYLPLGNLPIRYFDLPQFSYNSTSLAFYRENKNKRKFIEVGLSFSKKTDEGLYTQRRFNSLTGLSLSVTVPVETEELNIGLRFEAGRWIEKLSKGKLRVGFSSAVRIFVHRSELNTMTSAIFPQERIQSYLVLGFVPRVRYDFNSNIYFTINFPFELLGFGIDLVTIRNPSLTVNQQTQGGFDLEFGGEALIRLGVGYNF